jgi:hypothetical protein
MQAVPSCAVLETPQAKPQKDDQRGKEIRSLTRKLNSAAESAKTVGVPAQQRLVKTEPRDPKIPARIL